MSQGQGYLRAEIRSTLRKFLSQEHRSELKRLQGVARKRLAPVLAVVHGRFSTEQLTESLSSRLPSDFEVLMVHSSFDAMFPMYRGGAKELVSGLIEFCGPGRTIVMPSFVMGGRTYDPAAYFQTKAVRCSHDSIRNGPGRRDLSPHTQGVGGVWASYGKRLRPWTAGSGKSRLGTIFPDQAWLPTVLLAS